ncbi:hypothetical protein CONPUDRAFT_71670 [Coniophora puteana RWD-64-598 SS2]|uniref:MYND-type domain-containing protein n=1 Tax=Coniophora puteana (strain RWD-64-598) TaxID=741705 RepID=A0A5M3MVJ4_CONPW|nr:uncharacterized protein CONPUDRAFT_71670 [Coniophora puteana RWD-64-598 SS2]EIW83037.1 hypothetical protein CONPUDRAFT_71670 [Coniophora puteana RWD-64-598 SS2]
MTGSCCTVLPKAANAVSGGVKEHRPVTDTQKDELAGLGQLRAVERCIGRDRRSGDVRRLVDMTCRAVSWLSERRHFHVNQPRARQSSSRHLRLQQLDVDVHPGYKKPRAHWRQVEHRFLAGWLSFLADEMKAHECILVKGKMKRWNNTYLVHRKVWSGLDLFLVQPEWGLAKDIQIIIYVVTHNASCPKITSGLRAARTKRVHTISGDEEPQPGSLRRDMSLFGRLCTHQEHTYSECEYIVAHLGQTQQLSSTYHRSPCQTSEPFRGNALLAYSGNVSGVPRSKRLRKSGFKPAQYVLYCSKECQVKSWPTHKMGCRHNAQTKVTCKNKPEVGKRVTELRLWHAAHSPVFYAILIYALDLGNKPRNYAEKVLFIELELKPQHTQLALQNKYRVCDGIELTTAEAREFVGDENCGETFNTSQFTNPDGRLVRFGSFLLHCDDTVILIRLNLPHESAIDSVLKIHPRPTNWVEWLKRTIEINGSRPDMI